MSFRFDENGTFRGEVTFLSVNLPDGAVDNAAIAAAAGIAASKLEHRHRANYAQESDTTAAADTRVVHTVIGATGTLQAFKAGVAGSACTGNATVTVDLLVNGASVLTAAVVIDSGDAAFALVEGTIDSATLAADDVVEVAVTVDAGTGSLGTGAFAVLDLDEDAT